MFLLFQFNIAIKPIILSYYAKILYLPLYQDILNLSIRLLTNSMNARIKIHIA